MFPCSEMRFLATILISGAALSTAAAAFGLNHKALVFPEETNNSYVVLTPEKPLNLKAFTICMDAATELKGETEFVLFSYHNNKTVGLSICREKDGRFSLHLGTYSATQVTIFDISPLNPFKTHLCVTWESSTGLTAFWVDGKRTLRKVNSQGNIVQEGGDISLGWDVDHLWSFVGEISNVNMWDYVLSECQMKDSPKGNILDWNTVQHHIHGTVLVATTD